VACAEAKDLEGVDTALGKAQSARRSESEDRKLSEFGEKLMILNVSAALIDNGEFEAAARLLTSVEEQLDDMSLFTIGPRLQVERVFMMSLQGAFDEARSLALRMRPDVVADAERGTALRTIALLQTKEERSSFIGTMGIGPGGQRGSSLRPYRRGPGAAWDRRSKVGI
jgi:hypothetical protein